MSAVERFDDLQQRRGLIGYPLAVVYKFFDDQGTYLAVLIAYYGLLSLFPLLFLLVTALAFVLHGDPRLQEEILRSTLRQFPVIGEQLQGDIQSFRGNGLGIVVAVLGSVYGSLGVAQAAQNAVSKIWAVPRHARPDPLRSRLRSIGLLAMVGVGVVVSTALTVLAFRSHVFGTEVGGPLRAAATVASVVVNAGLLLLVYRVLTERHVSSRQLLGSAVGAALMWQILQWAGTYYVTHLLRGSTAAYGLFGIVLGMVAWLHLAALSFVLAAEATAVRVKRMWPRSLLTPFTDNVRLSRADRLAYESYVTAEAFKGFQQIDVDFGQEVEDEEDWE